MKQKIIRAESSVDMKDRLEEAMSYGWRIQSVVYGNDGWLAILTEAE